VFMFTRLLLPIVVVFSIAVARARVGSAPLAQTPGEQETRFDRLVRADFFAGLASDKEAFARAMQLIEETLTANPRHAEALVWRGSGLLFQAGQAYQPVTSFVERTCGDGL
jgi:hypothetical protein